MPNYATQYAGALSQAYPNVLHFGAIFARNQEGDYRWANNHTIEVPSLSVTGRVDGSRTSLIEKVQRHSNTWTPLTLRNHRAWEDFIHPRDIVETNHVLSIQNITRTMNEQEKFPEKDKYLISTLYADWLAIGRVPLTGVLTTANILDFVDQMNVNMTEHNVPAMGRILYVTPQANVILKGAISYYRNLTQQGNAPATIQRAIAVLDNVSVEEVPSDHMLTAYDFTVGAVRGAFLVAGLANEAATFTSAAGTTVGMTKITLTAPIGAAQKADSRFFYATDASTAPAALTFGTDVAHNDAWTEWDGESEIAAANGSKLTMLVASADGRVYAAGNGNVTAKT